MPMRRISRFSIENLLSHKDQMCQACPFRLRLIAAQYLMSLHNEKKTKMNKHLPKGLIQKINVNIVFFRLRQFAAQCCRSFHSKSAKINKLLPKRVAVMLAWGKYNYIYINVQLAYVLL